VRCRLWGFTLRFFLSLVDAVACITLFIPWFDDTYPHLAVWIQFTAARSNTAMLQSTVLYL